MPCDIIIPVFNQKRYTQECIESIKKNTAVGYRIIIVDDESDEPEMLSYLDRLRADNIVIIRNKENLGWVKSVNCGIAASSAEYVCIMNNDTLATDGWLKEMTAVSEKAPDIGLVNPEWEKPERLSVEDYANRLKKFSGEFIETDWARGFCFLVKREVINRIGGLDEAYSPGYYDDCDYSVRALRAGFRPVRAKAAYVYHYRNATHDTTLNKEGMNSLLAKHKELFYEHWGKPLRIVFVFSGKIAEKDAIENILFSLARRQHRLYLWGTNNNMPRIEHTNTEVRVLPKALIGLFTAVDVLNNLCRNKSKRYNIIFTDDARLVNLFSIFRLNNKVKIFLLNFNNSAVSAEIANYVDSVNLNLYSV